MPKHFRLPENRQADREPVAIHGAHPLCIFCFCTHPFAPVITAERNGNTGNIKGVLENKVASKSKPQLELTML